MSDVIGPNSYLPGQQVVLPQGKMCDTHPDRQAVARVVGECDSFGSEMIDCCQECYDDIKKAPLPVGTCDWCKTPDQTLHNHRDYEEGMSGPVYTICEGCLEKDNLRIAAEIAEEEESEVDDGPDYEGVYTDEFARY